MRASGILLHPTSLPGPFAIGDLGPEAHRFLDFLTAAGQHLWQVLPLGPTGYGDSPYSAFSAFAGNPLLVSPEALVAAGDLETGELATAPGSSGQVDYARAHRWKHDCLRAAARRFARQGTPERRAAYEHFCREQADWLDDHALYQALRAEQEGRPWGAWPEPLRQRDPAALAAARDRLAGRIALECYSQFVFHEQWFSLKRAAGARGLRLFGDLPIYVAHDSADVWAHRRLFHLDDAGQPRVVAGVPPDYFSPTGQRWGNPLYRWDVLAAEGFGWWLERLRWNLTLFDLVRIDHFRGLEACWTIPAAEPTAIHGHWEKVPGEALLEAFFRECPAAGLVAEDLGVITPEVEALRERFALPGMKILQFAFDSGSDNPYLPHNLTRNCVVYTGTHDNATTLGWWRQLSAAGRAEVRAYLGHSCRDMPWDLIRAAAATVADTVILPAQDLLSLGPEARMNHPGSPGGNWAWRLPPGALDAPLAERLAALTRRYGRSG